MSVKNNIIKQQSTTIEDITSDLEILNRIRKHQRLRQRKYIQGKKERGYIRMTLWLNCSQEIAPKIRYYLQNLTEDELRKMINE